jgi:group II intron reverse transcriptase/maturase
MKDRKFSVQTSLEGIAKKADSQKDYRFRNLYGMLNEEMLKDSWRYVRKDAAWGVDRVSAREYERNLEENVRRLVEDLKAKRYRAKLVRRQYIPKGEGKYRPLGIPATEDKLLQLAVKRLLEAIYEKDFLRCSYGYRPEVGALDAVDKLTIKLQFGKYNYVVEADIKGFFDNIDHEWMMKMLAERIDDKAMLWLIKKWLKAGVLDTEGKVLHPAAGTPQGGIISPLLANVYLHYVLDLWFKKRVKGKCTGEACLIRYADDFVCAFEREEEAHGFYQELAGRLAKFGLALSPEKSRVIPFSRDQQGKSRFDFLGFEFSWGRDRKGEPHVERRTARKRLRSSMKRLTEWSRENRHLKVSMLIDRLNAKLRGYYNYYGVQGNSTSLKHFHDHVVDVLKKRLNQRSQHKSYNWAGFRELLGGQKLEQPRIVGRPKARLVCTVA